jgi:hypothetical protein
MTMGVTVSDGVEQAERAAQPLIRTFAADVQAGDGRTVDVTIVPYSIAADVSDDGIRVYREQWDPGCFDDQLRAANRVDVLMNFEHERGIGGLVGRGLELRSSPDGLHGTFRIFAGQDGDKALELVNEGVLRGVSLEAYPKKSVRSADGVVRRVRAHLDKVALCRRPTWKEARVVAVREEVIIDEELLLDQIDPVLLEKIERIGIAVPAGLKAHPVNGTPTDVGTPTDGTRQNGEPKTDLEDAHHGRRHTE